MFVAPTCDEESSQMLSKLAHNNLHTLYQMLIWTRVRLFLSQSRLLNTLLAMHFERSHSPIDVFPTPSSQTSRRQFNIAIYSMVIIVSSSSRHLSAVGAFPDRHTPLIVQKLRTLTPLYQRRGSRRINWKSCYSLSHLCNASTPARGSNLRPLLSRRTRTLQHSRQFFRDCAIEQKITL